MKSITIYFEDKEFQEAQAYKKKHKLTWKELIELSIKPGRPE